MGFNCTGNFQLQGGLENRRSLCCEKAGKAYQEKVSLVQKQEFIKYLNVKLHYISLQRSSQDIYIYFLN